MGIAGLFAASAAAQTFNTYLPPEFLQRAQEPRSRLLQLGLFDLNPHVAASSIYDSNIRLRSVNGKDEDDLIFVLSPGIDVYRAPDHDAIFDTRLTYNPAFVFFTQHGTNDSIDHFLQWNGGMTLSRLSVTLSQDYQSSSGGTVDIGSRVNQTTYSSGVGIRYELTEKTSVEMRGTYRITDYERLIGSTEWSEDNSFHYQISPKVRLGLGVTVGQLDVAETPEPLYGIVTGEEARKGGVQTFVSPSLRATYHTSEKTDVTASVGEEYRTYVDGEDGWGPVFSLSGSYQPWQHTSISVEAHRREQNSAVLSGQDYITTGVSLSIQRAFRERFRARLSFTYDNAEYQAASRDAQATRADDYFLLRSSVDAILANGWTIGVFYQYRVNESSSDFSFDNHQVGIQTIWSY